MTTDRLIELEIKISHQELAIEKLQEAQGEHEVTVQRLEQALKLLRERLEAALRGDGTPGPADEKPPHY